MPSSLSWLDFSEVERRKMIEIVSLFKGRDKRDELGLASIRDSFADLLFPGTSTLQTRAIISCSSPGNNVNMKLHACLLLK